MPTDLGIAVFCCSAFLQAHPFENGVLAKLLLNGQNSLLLVTLPFQSSGIFGLLTVSGLIVREQVKLFDFRLSGNRSLINNMVCNDIQAPDKQIWINDTVVELRYRLQDLSGGGSVLPEIARAMGMLRDLPSVVTSPL